MECQECGSEGSKEVAVEFTDGSEWEIALCDDCRAAYRRGTLVAGVDNE